MKIIFKISLDPSALADILHLLKMKIIFDNPQPAPIMHFLHPVSLVLALAAVACSSGSDEHSDTSHTDTGGPAASLYEFPSAFFEGESSVSYSGQTYRHLLIADLKAAIGSLTEMVDANPGPYASPGATAGYLSGLYYTGELLDGMQPHAQNFAEEALQTTYDEVSSGKNLQEKMAGNDSATDHSDWSTGFAGWGSVGDFTPESLLYTWLEMLDANVVTYATGGDLRGIDGSTVTSVFLTEQGHDLQQLIQKFLVVAIAFSQAADDYTDDDTAGKGLLATHSEAAGADKAYSALEHAWDEAFGYFGAAQAYGQWSDTENTEASTGRDTNGDGVIDLLTEVNWGDSVNAAKRDLGAMASTDFTTNAWDGFLLGRQLLAETAGSELTSEEMAQLKAYRNLAIGAWEKTLASTAVHYINATLRDLNAASLDAADLAKHWSELKGFALGFQFNPNSSMSTSDFLRLHELIGDAPSLESGYSADLLEARSLLQTAYDFDAMNMGDEDGENGW